MKRVSVRVAFFLCCAVFLLFLLFPDVVRRNAEESVLFCGTVLIPSLFPGFVLADLLIRLSAGPCGKSRLFEKAFRLPSVLKRCWLIGLFAGFPSAADCVVQQVQRGEVAKEDAERCLAFTNNPGIVFVLFAVGVGVFGSLKIGLYLWGIQVLSALFSGVLLANKARSATSLTLVKKKKETPLKQLVPRAVSSSVSAVLNICGFVVFFRVLIGILTFSLPLRPIQVLLAGILEMTCGVSHLGGFDFVTALLTSFILGWSGFSVHFQIMSRVALEDLSLKYYFPGKVLQALLSSIFTFGTYALLFPADTRNPLFGIIVLITSVILLFALRLRKERLWKTKTFERNKNA